MQAPRGSTDERTLSLTAPGRKIAQTLIQLSREIEANFAKLAGLSKIAMLRELLSELAAALEVKSHQPMRSSPPHSGR